ncbi:MAG: hypothetical protein ABIJ65_11840 [Chloroflexota bacterium]
MSEPTRAEHTPVKAKLLQGIGLVSAVGDAPVDNFTLGGEVNPLVIVTLLLAVSGISGIARGWRSWTLSLAACSWI